jgi:hypothetical protein
LIAVWTPTLVSALDHDRIFGALGDATQRDIVRRAIDGKERAGAPGRRAGLGTRILLSLRSGARAAIVASRGSEEISGVSHDRALLRR